MNSFEAYILTPEGSLFSGTVTGVKMPGSDGSFEVKTMHAGIISTLQPGKVLVRKTDGKNLEFAVSGGLVEVHNDVLNLLAEAAEPVEEIDVERAERSKKRAKERLSTMDKMDKEIDRERALKALARAENRIKLSADVRVKTQ